jgi:putative CocE/NonD family hydrolase
MSIGAFFVRRAYGLSRPRYKVTRTRGIVIPARDGTPLETEVFSPRPRPLESDPTLLMRVPYGLRGFSSVAEVYAGRGFHVVIQACRGTGGSGGEFDPLSHERDDGLVTLEWIKAQSWFDGRIGLSGPSYLGYATWAICDALPKTAAMATKVTSAEFRSVLFPGGGFHLGLGLSWLQIIEGLRHGGLRLSWRMLRGGIDKRTAKVSMMLPLKKADRRLVGRTVPFWQRWSESAFGEERFWEALDHTHRLGARTPPNHFISGWYDFMVDQLLRDYRTLVEAGQTPYLTVGPWVHVSPELQRVSMRETITWMRAHLSGDREGLRDRPVRLYISGRNEWQDYDAFPGAGDDQIWHLHPEGVLAPRPVRHDPPDRYRYDPRHPTPNLGGAIFAFRGAGPVDQSALESRKDVLTFTSEPLFSDVTVIGNARVTLYARSSLTNTDFFVRLCDVDSHGVSINICDGIVRMTSGAPAVPDDIWKLNIRLHATGHCFRRDHRLRLQISSGAHPRYARNTGTDEPPGEATTLVAADIEIFHDPEHPSVLVLPVQ